MGSLLPREFTPLRPREILEICSWGKGGARNSTPLSCVAKQTKPHVVSFDLVARLLTFVAEHSFCGNLLSAYKYISGRRIQKDAEQC